MRRPQIHFTTPRGWMNDPNGAIFVNGVYHLFYQHYPNDIQWGPMHWGHAKSRDLIHWEHEPIAIAPLEDEYVFSGSCYLDVDNVSNLGTKEQPALLAFYTAHHPSNGLEEQCVAYSLDYKTFTRYEQNPVIRNTENLKDFRDPKVFKGPKGDYNMVISEGRRIGFYVSSDLLHWKKCSEFDPSQYGFAGICECPDCFSLMEGDSERFILTMSMILDVEHVSADFDLTWKEYRVDHVMQYFVGRFDGEQFIDTQVLAEPSVLDYGTDNYAMTTFYREQKEPKTQVMIGWAEFWPTVDDRPTISGVCKGKMTMARQVSLVRTSTGLRLAMKPYLTGEYRMVKEVPANDSVVFNPMVPFLAKTRIDVEGTIRICNGSDEEILIEVTEHDISVDCRYASSPQFGLIKENLARDLHIAKRHMIGACDLTLIYDAGILEVYAEEGVTVFTINVYPNIPYTQMIVVENS